MTKVKQDNIFTEEMVDVVMFACACKIASFEFLKIVSQLGVPYQRMTETDGVCYLALNISMQDPHFNCKKKKNIKGHL